MVNTRTKCKIALVGYSLSHGGLEKVIANLSFMLGKNNFEVHTIILSDDIGYDFHGKLVNIEKNVAKYPFSKLSKYAYFFFYLRKHKFDYIIDLRYRLNPITEILICKLIYNAKIIFGVHSSKIDTYFFKNRFLTKFIYSKNYAIVCASKGIEEKLRNTHVLRNIVTIYNGIDIAEIQQKSKQEVDLPFKFIISIGRFERQNIKQFDKLIEAYLESNLKNQGIHLLIIGDGITQSEMQHKFSNEEYVHFVGHISNPYPYIHQSEFLVLSSKYEGFPMVLIESLASGVPVISFDCPTGPNEIILHEENGLLVSDQNFETLKKAMERGVNDVEFLEKCKKRAKESVEKFDFKVIANKWIELFNKNIA
ncbi:glycosyltransferase [Flavobacterium luminosum]|uniref:Glycosyltransferase n=1 Tax=Flavobacterium luminosum TaxID=2949086 RepID=A0ABT0TLZ6_9FLAO|nr:glycosyltransferase [Flavobacterium sp. HXWNR70]MCL9808512.1 glycosyltransferase [Flavobacterium sp. HXWNR70]